jgi:hypothetical protein
MKGKIKKHIKIYELPFSIPVNQNIYKKWLYGKASSIKRRNIKRGDMSSSKPEAYREAIHRAVCDSNGKDFYTGEKLDWSLLSKYRSIDAKRGGLKYFRKFSLLPTVDHYKDRRTLNFKICSWRANDAKSHMSYSDFIGLCRKVIAHRENLK